MLGRGESAALKELAVAKRRNDSLQKEVVKLTKSIEATKESASYRLGRALVEGLKSPRQLVSLPAELARIAGSLRERRKKQALSRPASPDQRPEC